MKTITYQEFEQFPRARKPAFKVWADFGSEIGVLQTSAQVTITILWKVF